MLGAQHGDTGIDHRNCLLRGVYNVVEILNNDKRQTLTQLQILMITSREKYKRKIKPCACDSYSKYSVNTELGHFFFSLISTKTDWEKTPKKRISKNVHCSIIHNCQDMEII